MLKIINNTFYYIKEKAYLIDKTGIRKIKNNK